MDPLLPSFRRELRARAHHLHPVVSIGQHGLTPAVLHEIDVALTAHELIKVRMFGDDRAERGATLARVCEALDCAAVQQIGKLLVLWRARPVAEDVESARPAPRRPRRAALQPAAAGTPTRRRPAAGSQPAAKDRQQRHRATSSTAVQPARVRVPGKAPPGVPRAAAPRRRRRAS